MAKRKLKLTLPTELVTEPLVYNLSREYRLSANIQRASMHEDKGLVVLDLEGSEEDLNQGTAWIMARGVEIEPLEVEAKQLKAEVS
jgi:ABC-type methionine transport system ATPase subunit